jgi:hypothetical protein
MSFESNVLAIVHDGVVVDGRFRCKKTIRVDLAAALQAVSGLSTTNQPVSLAIYMLHLGILPKQIHLISVPQSYHALFLSNEIAVSATSRFSTCRRPRRISSGPLFLKHFHRIPLRESTGRSSFLINAISQYLYTQRGRLRSL